VTVSARFRVAALLAAVAIAPARADRLHLQGGGVIEADRWWIDGDTLHVESAGGTIGLPRAMLVRVEAAHPRKAAPLPPRAAAPTGVTKESGADAAAIAEATRLMGEGNAALTARDYDTAEQRFYDVIQRVPDAPGPRVGYALAEMALGRDPMALPMVLDGLVRAPSDPELLEVLGDLHNRDERVDEALSAWQESFRVAPNDRVRGKIEKASRELAAGRGYRFTAAAHFNLKYDGELDADLVGAITDFLEDAYGELSALYRDAPPQPITVLLYPQQAFHDVTQLGPEVAGVFDGKIRVPLAGLKTLTPRARRVLRHELTHAIVQDKTRGACPRWLHEGLAQMAEPRALPESEAARLRGSVRPDDPRTWPDRAFSYPAALSFTRYLASRRGFDTLVAVLGRVGDGESLEAALESMYGEGYASLARTWAATLGEGDGS
jgi:tetratricopeptide (TPR) repeat protein